MRLHRPVEWPILGHTMSPREPDPAFVPISPNPFIVGNPVRDRSMFFGREAEFDMVRSRFQQARDCGLLVFCGERRSGKTSILFQILDQRLGPEFIPVLIDMQSMAITNEADFLDKIADEVLAALGPRAEGIPPPDFTGGSTHAATFQKFIARTLKHCPDHKLILLFDEYELFENKIDAGVLSKDTLGILSNLMEHHSVFLVFTGSQHLDQRHRDYWKTLLAKSTWKQISYLERSDAERLIRSPVAGRATYADGTVAAIFRLSAGQPFYTQAICQSLVDQLNERKTREVTHEILGEVVRGLVSNPLPQMIFLWDSLGRDEKLTLALLAEALSNDTVVASEIALEKLIYNRDYRLEMTRGQIAAAMATLFRAELLEKDEGATPARFAFRMDLWRLWIRRMHSVWQVMRELGIKAGPSKFWKIGPYKMPVWAGVLSILVIVAGAVLVGLVATRPPDSNRPSVVPVTPQGPTGTYVLEVNPLEASIELPGVPTTTGTLRTRLAAEKEHTVTMTAPGYQETTLVARVTRGDTVQTSFSMRALLGNLRIETSPPGALVTVNGKAHGSSPAMVRSLPLARLHEIVVTLSGYEPSRTTEKLTEVGSTLPISLALKAKTADLVVTSEPTGASIVMDDRPPVVAPTTLPGVSHGSHRFTARLKGFRTVEKTIEVSNAVSLIPFPLEAEPPGVLGISGDKPAMIYLNTALIGNDVPYAERQLPPGTYVVLVVTGTGQSISKTIVIESGSHVVYNFSKDSVTRRP